MSEKFSEEFLNAFVDDQLAAEEKSRAYLAMQQDESLNREVCELRKVSDLVKLAYRDVPPPPSRRRSTSMRFSGLAATVALVLGVVLGWMLHAPETPAPATEARLTLSTAPQPTTVANAALEVVPAALRIAGTPSERLTQVADTGQMKVLIHISDGHTGHLKEALDEIENLARYYRAAGQNARIEVVTNGEGINLLRADVSPFRGRIAHLQKEYDNVTFEACQNTLDILKHDKGIVARLLPGVTVIDSGVAQIMRRQYEGWAYIQV